MKNNKYMDRVAKAVKTLLLMMFSATTLSSCLHDNIDNDQTPAGPSEERVVRFSLRVPGANNSGTRALGDGQENEVTDITVLVLNPGGNVYRVERPTNRNGSTFDVTLPVGTYDLMILANMDDIIAEAFPGGITRGTTRTQLTGGLLKSRYAGSSATDNREDDKWISDPDDAQDRYLIPLWGQITGKTISEAEGQNIGRVNLYRMVARIDVKIPRKNAANGDIITENNFKLTQVTFHNYNTTGRVVPGLTASDGDWEKNGGGKASCTSLPAAPNMVNAYNKYQKFTTFRTITPGEDELNEGGKNTELSGVIYTFEANKGATYQDRPCVIIGGEYQGGQTTYYRVDFIESGTKNYLDILRNHRYIVYVKSISGPGYETIQQAYESIPVNLEASVVKWDESGLIDIVFDGQYALGVSNSGFEVNANRTSRSLKIKADYPTGWDIVVTDNAGNVVSDKTNPNPASHWLAVSQYSSSSAGSNTITITAAENESGVNRQCKIVISSGRLSYEIPVSQSLEYLLDLKILQNDQEIDALYFDALGGVTPDAQTFVLEWMPSAIDCQVHIEQVADEVFRFDGPEGDDLSGVTSISNPSGEEVSYKIQPSALPVGSEAFYERSSRVTFTIKQGDRSVSKTLYLKQMVPLMELANDIEYVSLDGSRQYINLASNVDWTVSGVTYRDSAKPFLAAVYTESGTGISSGEPYWFRSINADPSEENDYRSNYANVTFRNERFNLQKTVTIYPTVCGRAGTPRSKTVDGYTFDTHMYGVGTNMRCWMVSNSTLGEPFAIHYGQGNNTDKMDYAEPAPSSWTGVIDISGDSKPSKPLTHYVNYYLPNQLADVCPQGWRLPTRAEVEVLVNEVNADVVITRGIGVAKWWSGTVAQSMSYLNGRLKGSSNVTQNMTWYDFNSTGFWWAKDANSKVYHFTGSKETMGATGGEVSVNNNIIAYNVRCVQETD